MAASTLHIVFNSSAAAGLRDALRQAGRDERVVGLSDCLSFGPINPPDPELRREWVETELDYAGWENVVSEATSFWSTALSTSSRRVRGCRDDQRKNMRVSSSGCGGLTKSQSKLSISPTSRWQEMALG